MNRAFLLGLAVAFASSPALAKDHVVAVPMGDLDLATTAGAAELDRRLARAAAEVCNVSPLRALWVQRFQGNCRATLKADLVAARSWPTQVSGSLSGQ
jgi:UrcA family protein